MADDVKKGMGSPNYDPGTAQHVRSEGGQSSASNQDMSDLGQKGGQASQDTDMSHSDMDQGPKSPSDMPEDMGEKGGKASSEEDYSDELTEDEHGEDGNSSEDYKV